MAANPTVENVSLSRSVRPHFAPRLPQASLAASVREVFGRWRQVAVTREQLSRLDERILRDIGFDPEQARLESAKPFWMPYTLTPNSQR